MARKKHIDNHQTLHGPQVKPQRLKILPIAHPDETIQKQHYKLVYEILKAKSDDTKVDATEQLKKFDSLVYQNYGLTQDEIGIVTLQAELPRDGKSA